MTVTKIVVVFVYVSKTNEDVRQRLALAAEDIEERLASTQPTLPAAFSEVVADVAKL